MGPLTWALGLLGGFSGPLKEQVFGVEIMVKELLLQDAGVFSLGLKLGSRTCLKLRS